MNIEEYLKKSDETFKIHSLEDLENNEILDPVEDYAMIISSIAIFEPEFVQEYILDRLKKGDTELVTTNLNELNLDFSLELTKASPEFKEILFSNFTKALENPMEINEQSLSFLRQSEEGHNLIQTNWARVNEKTRFSYTSRVELMHLLNDTEDGKKILQDNLSTLMDGEFSYNFFIKNVLSEKLASEEQIVDVIAENPAKMFDSMLNGHNNIDGFMDLLAITNELLEKVNDTVEPEQIKNIKESMEGFISSNFEKIIHDLKNYNEEVYEKDSYPIEQLKFLKTFDLGNNLIKRKFQENYEEIKNNTDKSDTMDFLKLYEDIEIQNKPNDLSSIIQDTFCDITDPVVQWSITKICSELLEDQKLTPESMEIYGRGHFSKSVKIGNYIFKIGEDRSTTEIPQDERIIQPLIRQSIKTQEGTNVFLEVQDLVDKDWYKGLTQEEIDEELYKIYSEMRDRGVRWTDVRKDNVGRLLKPNSPEYTINGEHLEASPEATGIKGANPQTKSLPAGELVIIDTDFIFSADKSYSGSIASMHGVFEERYQEEKRKEEIESLKPETTPTILSSAIDKSLETITSNDIQDIVGLVSEKTNLPKRNDKTKSDIEPDEK